MQCPQGRRGVSSRLRGTLKLNRLKYELGRFSFRKFVTSISVRPQSGCFACQRDMDIMMSFTENFIVMLIQFERFVEEEEEAFMPNRLSATPLLLCVIMPHFSL